MEDAHETVAHFDGDPSTSFFAVYDGHGGEVWPVHTYLCPSAALVVEVGAVEGMRNGLALDVANALRA